MRLALVTGLAGERLHENERAFLADARPAGLILFARNCSSPDQVRRLVIDAVEAVADDDVLVLIDQEGGRVQRLRPPHWRALPPAAVFGKLAETDADRAARMAYLISRLTADDLAHLGVNMNCAPVLDLRMPRAHDIIGDRAYGADVASVVRLAGSVADGYLAGGVVPVIKHVPGHGRALGDSHLELPVVAAPRDVLEAADFAPFRALSHLPAAMTAHVVYSAVDPERPASISAAVTSEVIRGWIGFDGLLISDDLGMQALSGSYRERAAAVGAAGSDIALHCSGDLDEARQVAEAVPPLADKSLLRFRTAMLATRQAKPFDRGEAEAALAETMSATA
ncbi:MAG: beta-N-acetylhexosaminidase [Hyphomicrobiaceae bacterium]